MQVNTKLYVDICKFPINKKSIEKIFPITSVWFMFEDDNEFPIILSVQLSIFLKIKGIQKLLFDL